MPGSIFWSPHQTSAFDVDRILRTTLTISSCSVVTLTHTIEPHLDRLDMRSLITTAALAGFATVQAVSIPRMQPDQGVPRTSSSPSSFKNPVGYGPKWRYWFQDAAVTEESLLADVRGMAAVYSSGLEVILFASYGQEPTQDPTIYGYGSDAARRMFDILTIEAARNDLTVDFALGPNQGSGVPVESPDQEGFNTELVFTTLLLQANQSVENVALPSFRAPGAIATFAGSSVPYNVTTARMVAALLADAPDEYNVTAGNIVLDRNLTTDVFDSIDQVDRTVTVSTAPVDRLLFVFYSRRNGYPEAKAGFNGTIPGQPGSYGSWVVDHFSPAGAQRSWDFNTGYLVKRAPAELAQAGALAWEDSPEFRATVFWTEAFPERFKEKFGYDVALALPAVYTGPQSFNGANLPEVTLAYADNATNARFKHDYSSLLSDLYIDYIREQNRLTQQNGLTYSAQPSSGQAVDVLGAAAHVGVPECESLAGVTVKDGRAFVGGPHMNSKKIVSNEMGARPKKAFEYTMPELLFDAHLQFAGGSNLLVLHGYSNSGEYPDTTWPGVVYFSWQYGELHNINQPAWSHYPDVMKYLARSQYILQMGETEQVDLAIYRDGLGLTNVSDVGEKLAERGYSYDFISPLNLVLDKAIMSHQGRLAGPGYQAVLLDHEVTIRVEAAEALAGLCEEGLAVVAAGPVPRDIPGYEVGTAKKDSVNAAFSRLRACSTFAAVDSIEDAVKALAGMNRKPYVMVQGAAPNRIRHVHRTEGSRDYVWLWNTANTTTTFNLSIESNGTGAPFIMDLWSGTMRPSPSWSRSASSVILTELRLGPNSAIILGMSSEADFFGVAASLMSVTSPESTDSGWIAENLAGDTVLRSSSNATYQVYVDGKAKPISVVVEESPLRLDQWTLNVTAFSRPTDLSRVASVADSLAPIAIGGLQSWSQISSLVNISGLGTYSTEFELSNAPVGARLDLGPIQHTVKAWLNGEEVGSINPEDASIDIRPTAGRNQLIVQIGTTLLNSINSYNASELAFLGATRGQLYGLFQAPLPDNQVYGLVGPVTLTPYGETIIM